MKRAKTDLRRRALAAAVCALLTIGTVPLAYVGVSGESESQFDLAAKKCKKKNKKKCKKKRPSPRPTATSSATPTSSASPTASATPTPDPSPTGGGGDGGGGGSSNCPAYQPGELGSGAETSVVTEAATESAPVEVALETGPGLGFSSPDVGGDEGSVSHVYHNVVVSPAAASAGLYVRVEFAPYLEYDLFLRLADGAAVAYAAGLNPAPLPAGGLDGTGNGGHSEMGAEVLDGVASDACRGYTVDVSSAITPGGPATLKLWLGEPTFTPGD